MLLGCGMFFGFALGAQTNQQDTAESPYVVDSWGLKNGLPDGSVISIIQTHDGYLWFGTLHGLVRFDGVAFSVFDEANTPGLNSSRIVRLFEDSRTNLWVGTLSAGVFVIDRRGQVTKAETAGNQQAVRPVSICEDSDGVVWLLMIDGSLFRYQNLHLESVIACKIAMTETNGRLWLGTDQRLYEILKAPSGARAFAIGQTIPVRERLDFLLASRSGGFWMIADGRIQKWKDYRLVLDLGPCPWRDWTVTTACEDEEGNLIVGTYGDGVYWFDSKGKFTHLLRELSFNYVHSVMMDHEGSLWVGTDGEGLDRVRRKVFTVLPESQGKVVQSVAPEREGGLWIGYHGGKSVDYWNNGVARSFSLVPGASDAAGVTATLFVDRVGNVLAGASGGLEAHLFEFQTNRFLPFQGVSDVSAIHQDRAGSIWFGTRQGLFLMDGQNLKLYSTGEGLPSPDVRAIADDVDGTLWIGTGGGLASLHDGKMISFHKKDGLPSEDISALLVDSEGVLWIGTRGSGLARFSKNSWTHYTTDQGLAGDSIGYLLEDGDDLWLGSNAGLTRASKASLNDFAVGKTSSIKCRVYVEADGLPTRECTEGSQPAACSTTNGVLWFPTLRGLVFVDPSKLKTNSIPPPVIIESVSVEGESQNTNRFVESPSRVVIPPGKGHLEIRYTSLNPGTAARSRFKYRLIEGQQQTRWTDDEKGSRLASFPKLIPGDYQFQVTACNEDGVWNPNLVSLAVIVQPPFWQRGWFRGTVILSALAVIGGLVYYFSTLKLQRQITQMRQQEALEHERGRIARDLHDQLGANLTQVALLAEMAESDKNIPTEVEDHARQISQTARETTKALDEIVWAVNPSNDTLEGLVNYSGKYAQEYFALAGLRYRVDMPSQLPEVDLPPDVRHNVFLAFKESVNNVVKHAQATEVHIRLKPDENNFTFEIEDNGRGLGGAEQKSGRNGLRNMRKRMEDVGGSFSIGPAAEKGAIVRLTAPIKNRRSNVH